ncbi:hypothetical protein N7517_004715 [Penicillium concentricum]|uniref:Uncharacterized protein n=1 Tax=Penicillium concentricum TaxID=293559 RepID=A0A9W9S8R5_9EURO|nr:uncharacterized protein N7517_004715 [Penicillium concentricum]KAJ5372709.1 hypothetical protein N7517_004715 [Penicillium concentricum]
MRSVRLIVAQYARTHNIPSTDGLRQMEHRIDLLLRKLDHIRVEEENDGAIEQDLLRQLVQAIRGYEKRGSWDVLLG